MQIYKDLDVGTAKVTQKEMQGIAHHMIDICDIKDKSPTSSMMIYFSLYFPIK